MTTAREQIKEDIRNGKDRIWTHWENDAERGADAASDVWEPLVRDLVEAINANGVRDWAPWMQEAFQRGWEALGES